MSLLPKNFRFSWRVTVICVTLAAVMIRASFWQWDRYVKKVALVETYETHSLVAPVPLTAEILQRGQFDDLINRKVSISGEYDFSHQMITTNKKHASGPGHWLLTPLRIEGTAQHIIVSRGFIPFADREPESWTKYDREPRENLQGVLKHSIKPIRLGPKNPEPKPGERFARLWYYEEIEQMAKQLPYSVIGAVYIQRIGEPVAGEFPAQAVSIEVPPSTHFGYTIEWAILALITLLVGYVLQAMPRFWKAREE